MNYKKQQENKRTIKSKKEKRELLFNFLMASFYITFFLHCLSLCMIPAKQDYLQQKGKKSSKVNDVLQGLTIQHLIFVKIMKMTAICF